MEKLKRYNQVMLAILGTGAVAALVLGALALAVLFITDLINSGRVKPQGVIADSVAHGLASQKLRKQIISFEALEMLDSANNVYLLPVGSMDLEKPEKASSFRFGSLENIEGAYLHKMHRSGDTYNNFVLYLLNSNEGFPLFGSRIALNGYGKVTIGGEVYLCMSGSESDTNGDGVLNDDDLENMYVYFWRTRSLNKVSIPNGSFLDYSLLNNGKELVIHFGVDKNKDGRYQYDEQEPVVLYKYGFSDNKLKPFIDQSLTDRLQKLLEGQKPE